MREHYYGSCILRKRVSAEFSWLPPSQVCPPSPSGAPLSATALTIYSIPLCLTKLLKGVSSTGHQLSWRQTHRPLSAPPDLTQPVPAPCWSLPSSWGHVLPGPLPTWWLEDQVQSHTHRTPRFHLCCGFTSPWPLSLKSWRLLAWNSSPYFPRPTGLLLGSARFINGQSP